VGWQARFQHAAAASTASAAQLEHALAKVIDPPRGR
jgi:hypothetical protein